MPVVGPFIDFLRPRLDRLDPFTTFPNVGNTVWTKHTHYFIQRDLTRVFRDNQIHQIVNKRQTLSGE